MTKFYSQSGQDKWVAEIFEYKKNGFFVDIGAHDGVQSSNTKFLEDELGWKGRCIEANKEVFQNLIKNRKAINLNIVVTNYIGRCGFYGDTVSQEGPQMPCMTLDKILRDTGCPKEIDYISLDVEGHESSILECFPFWDWDVLTLTVEHNLYCWGDKNRNDEILSKNGFIRAVEDAPCLDSSYSEWYMKPYEDWYVKEGINVRTI